jgi:hypothetical protein
MENENIAKAKAAIEEVLKQHNVVLIPTVVHQGSRTFSHIEVVEVPEKDSEVAPAAEEVNAA